MNDSRYSDMSRKPKSFFLTPIENSGHNRNQSAFSHLNPVASKTPKHIVSASFDLSSARISLNLQMKVSALFKKPTVEEKQNISKRIEKNKNYAVMSKEAKAQEAQIKAFQHNIRAKVTKITKQKIYEEKKSYRQSMLKEKFQKFQYRINILV